MIGDGPSFFDLKFKDAVDSTTGDTNLSENYDEIGTNFGSDGQQLKPGDLCCKGESPEYVNNQNAYLNFEIEKMEVF